MKTKLLLKLTLITDHNQLYLALIKKLDHCKLYIHPKNYIENDSTRLLFLGFCVAPQNSLSNRKLKRLGLFSREHYVELHKPLLLIYYTSSNFCVEKRYSSLLFYNSSVTKTVNRMVPCVINLRTTSYSIIFYYTIQNF